MLSSLLSWTMLPEGSSSAVHLKRKINLDYSPHSMGRENMSRKFTQRLVWDQQTVPCQGSIAPPPEDANSCHLITSLGFKTYSQGEVESLMNKYSSGPIKESKVIWRSTWTPETPNFCTSSVKTPGSLSIRHQLPASDILGLALRFWKVGVGIESGLKVSFRSLVYFSVLQFINSYVELNAVGC